MSDFDKFDEYKFLVDDTARITDRRQNISTLYTTINSILLAAIAVLFTETSLPTIVIVAGAAAIMIAGVAIAIAWRNAINNYRDLLRLRFDVLYEMEQHPDLAESEKVYHREEKLYPRDDTGKTISSRGLFSKVERRLPEIFIGLYIILTATVIIASALQII